MPKKHKPVYNHQGSSNYTHPSLGSSKGPTVNSPPPPPATVNERLSQLRREQASAEQAQQQADFASRSVQRSVPPSLGGILGVPESAPPAPKAGARQRTRLRTPGPAPPRSWLDGSSSHGHGSVARSHQFGEKKCTSRPRASRHFGFVESVRQRLIPRQSLLHHVLKTLATNWQSVDDDGLWFLSECPGYIRSTLISYISSFGPEEGLSPRALEILLSNSESVDCLDLTALAGWTISIKSTTAILTERSAQQASNDGETESWDAEEPTIPTSLSNIPLSGSSAITKLSLAQPPPTVSWTDLLALTSKVPTLTHLSLSQWPFPTRTPNLVNATTSSPAGNTFAASGTSIYSLLDGDLTEARALLRQFSRSTYCLKHLDLTGCPWLQALLPDQVSMPSRGVLHHTRMNDDHWTAPQPTVRTGPDWLGSWKNLTFLNIAQMTPADALPHVTAYSFSESHPRSRESMNASVERQRLMDQLRSLAQSSQIDGKVTIAAGGIGYEWRSQQSCNTMCNACGGLVGSMEGIVGKCHVCEAWAANAKRVTDAWTEEQVKLRDVAIGIQRIRRTSAAPMLEISLGWELV
ncbi:hypothetical protein KVT40_007034 [Elsinoe batatas]|uniref:Uncharacterized protein n=1 Tax=Elsinoe batatas TaxID=2601811 RepID=A0A8K0L3U7_9PEZI|nr:hypothetical protein KVT40_007034 [Elsinoe batatas]